MLENDKMKQTIATLGKRLRRYNKSHNRKIQNRDLENNAATFYKQTVGEQYDTKKK